MTRQAPSTRAALALALALLALLAAPDAGAVTLVLPGGTERPQPWQRFADEARVPTPRGRITLHITDCPASAEASGCSYSYERIYVRPQETEREALLHELGHQFEDRLPVGVLHRFRRVWRRWMLLPLEREDFARTYAECGLEWGWGRDPAYRPLCGLICRAGHAQAGAFEMPRSRSRRACRWR